MEGTHTVNSGLSTMEALTRLHQGVKIELDECLSIRSFTKGFHTWIRDAYHHNSAHSLFRWTSAAIVGLEILFFSIFYAYGVENFRLKSLEIEMLLLSLFLLFNMCVAGWDSRLRHTEMHIRAEKILHYIEECKDNQPWKIGQYSHLHAPQSPCISLQWTWRDNQLINLPCHLLVEGDIIVLRPGHISPGKCCSVEKNVNTFIELHKGEIFAPADKLAKQSFSSPRLRKPAEAMKFIMMETPYVSSLRLALQDSLKRPVALFNKECHTVISYYLEIIIIPSVIITTVCFGALHAGYLNPANSEWTEHMLLRPILAIMPLVPLTLPVCWIILNVYGMAHLEALVEVSKQSVKSLDPFDEMEDRNLPSFIAPLKWSDIKGNCIALLFGRKGYLWRSANLLQVLGSITALCCVDKKGILSWPNPTAEKVFFLKPSKSKANSEDSTNLLSISAESVQKLDNEDCLKEEEESVLKKVMKLNRRKDLRDHIYHPGSQVEVLDLTHNVNSPYGIQFDDPNWKSYIGNLKPLGLGILLNTCNPSAQQHYSKFCDHIACESLYNDAAVPVVNKRCLCELAKQIGFTYSVVDFYDLQQQISLFRHVRPEVIQKGRLARSLNFPRLKLPFPNVSYAVVKDLHRGNLQLFSQGTADLILDACNEYWDGEDISVLTESDRKRILDFYHRSSLTAHCMGYAYGPLNMVPDHKFSEMLIELPSDSSHIFPSLKITANSARSWDHQSLNGHNKPLLNRYLSSDSLLLQEQEDSSGNITASINTCLQQLGNGIFIGMVTMQYQACPDFVQLIEQLDKACIRFVHFSKENELRSRVFSEKMGLESGWNCHISLLNEKTWSENCHSKSQQKCEAVSRKSSALHCGITMYDAYQKNAQAPFRCISAPSVINLDMTVVKFEEEISIHSKSTETIVDLCLSKEDDGSHLGVNDELFILQEKEGSSVQDLLIMDDSNLSHSPSHITESTDQSAPVTFDMSNRAKLPKGTENIRPHIENVDNVPLQVSLFTDCTPEATQEMICIMQEYGEVVCCLGSSANSQNMAIFLQADISIAVEPLHPQLCMQQPVFDLPRKKSNTGPFELCGILNSLPCALNFHREDPVSLYHLIMQARHFVINMRNSFQFMLCCCLSITLLQVFAVVFFLPLILPPAHVLWMVCVEIPLLSLSLMGNSMDSNVTTLATGKNTKAFNKQTILLFSMYYCAKFCPSVLASVCCFALIIANYCQQHPGRASDPCWIFLDISENEHGSSREMWAAGLTISQNVTATLIVIYLVFISFGYVRRSTVLCRGKLCPNKYWIISAPVVICMQLIFSVIDIALNIHGTTNPLVFIGKIPFYVWLIGSLWPFILIPLNEIVKKHEIKVNVRQQKRARLEFCTKLGMNSPF